MGKKYFSYKYTGSPKNNLGTVGNGLVFKQVRLF